MIAAVAVLAALAAAAVLGRLRVVQENRRGTPSGLVLSARVGVFGAVGLLACVAPALTLLPTAVGAGPLLVMLLVAPGLAVVGFRAPGDPLDTLVLAVAASMTALVLGGVTMLAVGVWAPTMLTMFAAVTAGPLLAWHALGLARAAAVAGR
ncbi:hypothetical protein [Pseudonocardia sp. WMMC193]|uniref:hypothetical protein n=1 Tax=Pseudonocardia sp. WMMC193 TaxID=2911965 RepID=UPI001F3034BC|nr:hypothetical protein [Pseudonocardia sp. WMMC193]MCF7553810.1 hypothetical protein [Pseudonocardia sp. WMMC193]